MPVVITTAQTDADIRGLLALQQQNLVRNVSAEIAQSQGFVTVEHTYELLCQMNQAAPQIVAKDHDAVVGYALVMPPSFQDLIPVLKPMFVMLAGLTWRGKAIKATDFYAMGQICVAGGYRGAGIFDALYAKHRELMAHQYKYCITEVAVRNTRSMRAHDRVGFEVIHTFEDHTDHWNIMLMELKPTSPPPN